VVIHALVDAILGALGKGDIGEHFPDSHPAWQDAASARFLEHAVKLARDDRFRLVNADVTILAERPKLREFKVKMVAALSESLGGPVNVKAGTNEGCDAVGRGEAIAAHAVVVLARDSD
jgi:2-C-methyl-D-erythritol 4-phosphate cytidylyltransferase/2-C-methyl-D-erythritol 2,4-cyclodiphosphate synthase